MYINKIPILLSKACIYAFLGKRKPWRNNLQGLYLIFSFALLGYSALPWNFSCYRANPFCKKILPLLWGFAKFLITIKLWFYCQKSRVYEVYQLCYKKIRPSKFTLLRSIWGIKFLKNRLAQWHFYLFPLVAHKLILNRFVWVF